MCRALLDPGSQSNMTQELLQNLKLPWTKRSIPISGINQMQTDTSKVTEIKIEATNNGNGVFCFACNYGANPTKEN